MKRAVVSAAAVVALVALAGAQGALGSTDDLEGSWKRDESKSEPLRRNGQLVADTQVSMMITRAGRNRSELAVKRTLRAPQGSQVRELTYSTDGGSNVNSTVRAVEIRSTSRLQGDTLTIDGRGVVQTPSGPVEQLLQERWTLSADGRILTIASTMTTAGREYRYIEVFARKRWLW